MINNEGKVAVIFGVRNESSIAWAVALKLQQSGCRVALSYVEETKEEVLYLMQQHGMDGRLSAAVDVRDESQITSFIQSVNREASLIDYVLHAVAYGSQQVMCTNLLGSTQPAPSYLDIPFRRSGRFL